MPTNRLPKKGIVDSLIYLNNQFNRIQRELCCSSSVSGGIQSIVPGTNISVDNTDPQNPIISTTIGNTIYTGDGTLSGARIITGVNSTLSITNTRTLLNGAPDDGVSVLKVAGDILSHGSKFMSTDNVVQCSLIGSGAEGRIGTQSNHNLFLITNNTEKARITNSGRILIATTIDNGINTLQVNGTISGAIQNGNTAGRPASPITGQMYFDTSLSPTKPIWYNGTTWVDAIGIIVP